MKRLLVMVAAVSLCASAAWGDVQVMEFYPTRDTGINKAYGSWGTEAWTNMGAISQCRIAKARQHFLLMDFDWAAVKAFTDTMTPGERPIYQLGIVPVGSGYVDDHVFVRIVMAANNTDWIVGDGNSQFTEFNWTDPDVNAAVTSQYAQSYGKLNPGDPLADPPIDPYWEPDLDKCTGSWPWGDFDGRRNSAGYYNTRVLLFRWDCNNRNWVQLDSNIIDDLVDGTAPDGEASRGLYTYDFGNFRLNHEAYTSEAGAALSPMLRVTIPEPATLLLIGLGGVGLLLRKRR